MDGEKVKGSVSQTWSWVAKNWSSPDAPLGLKFKTWSGVIVSLVKGSCAPSFAWRSRGRGIALGLSYMVWHSILSMMFSILFSKCVPNMAHNGHHCHICRPLSKGQKEWFLVWALLVPRTYEKLLTIYTWAWKIRYVVLARSVYKQEWNKSCQIFVQV